MKNKSLQIIITAVALLLLIPFIAMQFTDEEFLGQFSILW